MKKVFFALLAFAALLSACTTSDNAPASGTRKVALFLTDAPADADHFGKNHNPWKRFTAVNLDIASVQYVSVDSISKDSVIWKDVPFAPQTYTVSLLSNGDSLFLSEFNIPENQLVRKIKFKLGKNSTVVLSDNTVKPLIISDKSDSTLIFHVRNNVPKGTYSIMLDFDIAHSIILRKDGNFYLKPVMRCFVRETTASIRGFVLPVKLATKVFVVVGTDTITTVSDIKRNNRFMLDGFTAGTYTVQFMPLDSTRVTRTKSVEIKKNRDVFLGGVKVID